jgi:hypothetical protein
VILLAGALALTAAGATNAIVPGRSIGDVRIPSAKTLVEKELGRGIVTSRSTSELGTFANVRYVGARLVVTYRVGTPWLATSVRTTSTRYVTPKGIRVGARGVQLRRAYPAANCGIPRTCRLGLPLAGRRVTVFSMKAGRIIAITIGLVID